MQASGLTTGLIVGAAVLYTASGAFATRSLFRGEAPDAPTGRRLAARVTLALGALALTLALAHATWAAGHLPVYDLAGACLVLIWTASAVYLAFDRTAPVAGLQPVLFPVVLVLFAAGGLLALRGDGPATAGSPAVVALHVLMAIAAYAAFLLAAAAGVLYLVQERAVRRGVASPLIDRLPSLQRLDRITLAMLVVGLPLLTAALLVGLGQAHALGASQLWRDPTVAGAVVLWGFYAVVLLLRGTARVRGRKVAWATIVGFVAVLATLLGTSLLGEHDHPTRRVADRTEGRKADLPPRPEGGPRRAAPRASPAEGEPSAPEARERGSATVRSQGRTWGEAPVGPCRGEGSEADLPPLL